MYREFFGLKSPPFNNTPDPRFFFNTPDHEEALASLHYGVTQRKGFVLVTGEVGAGKTLLSRLLLNRLPSNVRTAVITNTSLTGTELLAAICREFELDVAGASTTAALSNCLEKFLLEQYARDRLAVVILDEAQNLPNESLEQLRMLGNLEANDAKLLQVLILGQPELQASLRRPTMQQTFQRIFRAFHLKALDRKLTAEYIAHRLRIAGLPEDQRIFNDGAIEAVYQHSHGIPRVVNQICDNAMLAAYGESRQEISGPLIQEVVGQMMSLSAPPGDEPEVKTDKGISSQPGDKDRHENLGLAIPAEALSDELNGFTAPEVTGIDPARLATGLRIEDPSERRLQGLSERLASLERSFDEARDKGQSSVDCRTAQEETAALQERTEQLLQDVKALTLKQQSIFTQEADRRMRELLDKARQAAMAVQESARVDVEMARKQSTDLHEQTKRLMGEVQARARDEQSKFAQAAEHHMRELLDQARSTAEAFERRALADVESAQHKSTALQEQTRKLMEEVRSLAQCQRSELAQVITEQRAELETVKQLRAETAELHEKAAGFQSECQQQVRKTVEEAGTVCQRMEAQAAAMWSEAGSQMRELQGQIRGMLEEVRAKGDASQDRAAELLAQQRTDSEAAQRQIDAFTAAMSQRAAETDRENRKILSALQTEARSIVEQIREVHTNAQSKAEKASASVEQFVGAMKSKVESSHQRITELIAVAENEVQSSCASLHAAREQALADGENCRRQASNAVEQTRSMLGETRDQCERLLGELRTQIADQSAKAKDIWQSGVNEGSQTLSDLNTRLAEARKQTERARSELESLVSSAREELNKTRQNLESCINKHRADVTRLDEEAGGIKVNLQKNFEEAGSSLDAILDEHRRSVDERAAQIEAHTDKRLAKAEEHANDRIAQLKSELNDSADRTDNICTELRKSVQIVQTNAAECLGQFQLESDNIQKELSELMDRNRGALEDTRASVENLSQQARKTTQETRAELERLENEARAGVSKTGKDFEELLSEATARAEAIRAESETMASELAQRMGHTQEEAAKAVQSAEKTTGLIRQQGKRSLGEVRSCLSQMNERSEILQRDLRRMGEEIREAAVTTTEQLQNTGQRITSHIETLRKTAQNDADANYDRLSALRQQVEQSAEKMRLGASKLLDQVQSGTSALRQHADELLTQAQNGSEKLNESAANMLMQAQTSAERFREQAEGLLHQAEVTAGEIRSEVQELRAQVGTESQQTQQQIVAVKHDMAEARQEAARIRSEADDARKQSQAKAAQLLQRAESVQAQSETLLSMPKKLVQEAKQQAGALAEMSAKISTVVQQLSEAGNQAKRNKAELETAGNTADQKLSMLKQHTQRVGQLVGIIRQLYGAMDARIERLRGRLSEADELVRSVPQEIESLRAVLETDEKPKAGGPSATRLVSRPPQRKQPHGPSRQRHTPTPHGRPVSSSPPPEVPAATTTQTPAHTLGQIVRRNQKLNDWLRDMLGEEALADRVLQSTRSTEPAQTVGESSSA